MEPGNERVSLDFARRYQAISQRFGLPNALG